MSLIRPEISKSDAPGPG